MNKVILTGIAALLFAGIVVAQPGGYIPLTEQQKATEQEYRELVDEWKDFMGLDKNTREGEEALRELYKHIKDEYPMDADISKEVEEIKTQRDIDMEAKAKELGYANASEAFEAGKQEVINIYSESVEEITARTGEYYHELQYRYNLAAIDALKRLLENAKEMK